MKCTCKKGDKTKCPECKREMKRKMEKTKRKGKGK